ncbi:hypothetical protein PCASD_20229 [Puccinia coronata f. sp. avenae]|uniref:Uncharacterized protein n=1 Tax=Puccinia coronata f. sp. avenae TaxID=200324 RepID=A0A2N5TW02_9BASI|nr:hypothetical protein PCASD_20229 [Puccinia coronata f. sp. avenae]
MLPIALDPCQPFHGAHTLDTLNTHPISSIAAKLESHTCPPPPSFSPGGQSAIPCQQSGSLQKRKKHLPER